MPVVDESRQSPEVNRLDNAKNQEPSTGEILASYPPQRSQHDTTPLAIGRPVEQAAPRRKHRLRWIIPLVIVLVILMGGYVAISFYFADRVPKGATVAGVAIGGLTKEQAISRLHEELDEIAQETVMVTIGDQETDFDPVIAGIGFSAEQTVASVTGLSFSPARLWNQVSGIGAQEPALVLDNGALQAHISALAAETKTEPVSGTVTVATGEIVTTEPESGVALDEPAAISQIEADFLNTPAPWQLPVQELAPKIGQEQIDQAVEAIAKPLLSGPVTVVVQDDLAELPVAELAAAAVIEPSGEADGEAGSALALSWDEELLRSSVSKRLPEGTETEAEDAHFVFVDGQPAIEDGRLGSQIDSAKLAQAITTAALASGEARRATAELTESDPTAGRAELEKLGVKEIIGRFETQATNSADRTKNLRKAAAIVTGMLVRPGETFSLDDALGHRSLETGWFNAGVVVSGVSQDGIGGGLSQFSTTLYNASHLAGMVDVAHTPHSNYSARDPTGREATLWEGQIDNQFKNDTPYGVVLRAGVTDSLKVWVELWSTKYWTVESGIGQPYSYVAPRTVESTAADCKAQSGGISGFQVDYWRIKTDPDGNAQDKEEWHWRYDPMNAIVCKKPEGG
jgi:vancomycin resistance protein YoaR